MIWLGIIAIIFFGVSIIMLEGNMNSRMQALARFMYGASIVIFVFLIIVSVVTGIAQ